MNQTDAQKTAKLPEVSGWITAAVQHNGGSALCLWLCICLTLAFVMNEVVAIGGALADLSFVELITGLTSGAEFSSILFGRCPPHSSCKHPDPGCLWLFFFSARRQPRLNAAKISTALLRVVVTLQIVLYSIGLFSLLLCSGFLLSFGISAGSAAFSKLIRQIAALFGVGILSPHNPRWSTLISLALLAGLFILFLFHLLGCLALRRGLVTLRAQCDGEFGKRTIPYFAAVYVGIAPWFSVNINTVTVTNLGDLFTLLSLLLTGIAGVLGAILLYRHRKAMHQGQNVFTGALCHFKEDHSFIANHQGARNQTKEEATPTKPSTHFLDELTVEDPLFPIDEEDEEDTDKEEESKEAPFSTQSSADAPPCRQEPSPDRVCPHCGQPLQSHQRFCYNCGQTL